MNENGAHHWYIIYVASGSEKKIKEAIMDQIKRKSMQSSFSDIFIPVVEVSELKKGKQVSTEKRIMQGYMLINMKMSDESWHLVKSVAKVNGFLGDGNKPKPISQKEVEKIYSMVASQEKNANLINMYNVGEIVKVIDGPFDSFSGTILEVDNEKNRIKVSVSIFGRSTPIDLTFNQVKKNT